MSGPRHLDRFDGTVIYDTAKVSYVGISDIRTTVH